MTVGELREAVSNLPDDAPVIVKLDEEDVTRAWTTSYAGPSGHTFRIYLNADSESLTSRVPPLSA